jgi:hypothetical protein
MRQHAALRSQILVARASACSDGFSRRVKSTVLPGKHTGWSANDLKDGVLDVHLPRLEIVTTYDVGFRAHT